jgi:hypothetical protein
MAEVQAIMNEIKKNMPYFTEKYKVKTIGVFGSYVRGEQKKKSDVDVLVEFHEPISLLEFVALERELSERIGKVLW